MMDKTGMERLIVGPLGTNCFIVWCRSTMEAIIIDPGGDAGRIIDSVSALGVKPVKIVLTHGHSDHMAAAAKLKDEYGITLALHEADAETMKRSVADAPMWGMGRVDQPEVETLLRDGDEIRFGEVTAEVIHTPGHTLGGVCLYIDGVLYAGDTLFSGSIGRTDFYGGDMETILDSIRERLFTLPDETEVHCGHGPSTSIGRERSVNPFLNGTY